MDGVAVDWQLLVQVAVLHLVVLLVRRLEVLLVWLVCVGGLLNHLVHAVVVVGLRVLHGKWLLVLIRPHLLLTVLLHLRLLLLLVKLLLLVRGCWFLVRSRRQSLQKLVFLLLGRNHRHGSKLLLVHLVLSCLLLEVHCSNIYFKN